MAKKLISIKAWKQRRFVHGGAPSDATVRRWCDNGDIPAEKIGGSWFVDLSIEEMSTGNSIVDEILKAG